MSSVMKAIWDGIVVDKFKEALSDMYNQEVDPDKKTDIFLLCAEISNTTLLSDVVKAIGEEIKSLPLRGAIAGLLEECAQDVQHKRGLKTELFRAQVAKSAEKFENALGGLASSLEKVFESSANQQVVQNFSGVLFHSAVKANSSPNQEVFKVYGTAASIAQKRGDLSDATLDEIKEKIPPSHGPVIMEAAQTAKQSLSY